METKKEYKLQTVKMLLICIACILINMGGVRLMGALGWPLYMDSVGTVIAAAMSGYLPGVIVGLFTNLIKGISDTESLYYVVINALIALITYWYTKKGYIKKPLGILALIFSLAAVGWIYWILICIVMNDPLTGAGVMEGLVTELADKGITVLIVLCLLFLLPMRFRQFMEFRGWQQKPLTDEQNRVVKKGVRCGHQPDGIDTGGSGDGGPVPGGGRVCSRIPGNQAASDQSEGKQSGHHIHLCL